MRVGHNQLETLVMVASPTSTLLTQTRDTAGLVKKGLLRKADGSNGMCITAAGLRVLADEMEAGRVDDALERMRKWVAERNAKIAAKST